MSYLNEIYVPKLHHYKSIILSCPMEPDEKHLGSDKLGVKKVVDKTIFDLKNVGPKILVSKKIGEIFST